MNTLNIVTERKVQILAEKLAHRILNILDQISNIHDNLMFAKSFSEVNKYNKQLKKLLNVTVYYMIITDKLADKYQGELTNSYSIYNQDMYSVLKDLVRKLSHTINKLY